MSVQTIGGVTGNAALIFVATIYTGLDAALNNPAAKPAWHGIAGPIVTYQNVAQQLASMPGAMGKVIPKTAIFPFSPPTAVMDLLAGQTGRTLHPLVRESLTVQVQRYGTGYYVDRSDFFADVYGIIRKVPEKLARPATKLGDVLLAAVLRTGKVTVDWTNTNFFAASKPVAPSGTSTAVYPNLYTGTPLLPAGVQKVWSGMRALKNEDGLSLNIRPDTLIIPAELEAQAIQATQIEYPVYSQTANPFNAGQAAATAAMGQNWIATTKAIKQIVVLPELTQGGQVIDTTSWYMAECLNPEHGGAPGLVFAEDPAVDFFVQMDLNDTEVYNNDRFAWAIQKWAGAGPGLGQFIARADA